MNTFSTSLKNWDGLKRANELSFVCFSCRNARAPGLPLIHRFFTTEAPSLGLSRIGFDLNSGQRLDSATRTSRYEWRNGVGKSAGNVSFTALTYLCAEKATVDGSKSSSAWLRRNRRSGRAPALRCAQGSCRFHQRNSLKYRVLLDSSLSGSSPNLSKNPKCNRAKRASDGSGPIQIEGMIE